MNVIILLESWAFCPGSVYSIHLKEHSMKRFLYVLFAVMLVWTFAIGTAVPAMAHGQHDENDEPASDPYFEPLALCSDPAVFGGWEALEKLSFYESLLYSMEVEGLPEVLPTDFDHEQFHEGEYLIEWFADGVSLNKYGKGGCHGNITEYCRECSTYWGGGWNCRYYPCRIHWRHCPADKCGGYDCP